MSTHQKTTQAELSAREEPVNHKMMEKITLFTEDGENVGAILTDLTDRIEALEGEVFEGD